MKTGRVAFRVALAAFGFFPPAVTAVPSDAALFKRGDSNGDSRLDLSDVVVALDYLFLGGPRAACEDAADINDDGAIDMGDAFHLLGDLFLGGPRPALPSLQCGADPTADALACESYPPCGRPGELLSPRLARAGECAGVSALFRDRAVRDMEAALDLNEGVALAMAHAGTCWYFFININCSICSASITVPEPETPAGDRAEAYSETNNQVEGVDEADLVKTDGAFIYVVAGGRFQIIDAWPAPEARRIAAVEIAGTPKKLLVAKDRAVVYSSLGPLGPPAVGPPMIGGFLGVNPGECTYGYDCEFTGDGRRLKVTVLDISDRGHPRTLREIEFDGSYLAARRIGDLVHTVVVFPEVEVPGVSYWPDPLKQPEDYCAGEFPYTEDDVRGMFTELRSTNLALIEEAREQDLLPQFKDTRQKGDAALTIEGPLRGCEAFYLSPSGDGSSLISVVSFRIDDLQDLQATTILGRPGPVYASGDSLYIGGRQQSQDGQPWYFQSREETPEATAIHKFQLLKDRPGSAYLGSGVVKGRVLNQFSLDEEGGYLRVATTTGRLPSPAVHSTVSVLAQETQGLGLFGQIDRLAPAEDIRSVRFDGDTGYLVTFKKTDPLFVLDLADPGNPRVRGELEIPGFSTYLHLLDDRHLLSIGFDAIDQGTFALFHGILLQLFDVGDLASPRLLHREVIGTRGSGSDAAADHLAFNYFRPRSLLAFPMVICEGGQAGQYADKLTFNGLLVYRVDLEKGFQSLGGVPHPLPEPGAASAVSCSRWWTRQDSPVKRSIFMDDYVFSVALDRIKVSRLADLEHPVCAVSLAD